MRRLAWFWALVLSISLVTGTWAEEERAPREKIAPTLTDVKYGPHERNVLDVYMAKSDKPTPVFIFFHGAGSSGATSRS